jgi:hypothetical protein
MARPVVHGLRAEYQDRVNFVILDYDGDEDHAFARDLELARHPAYGLVAPDSDEVVARVFGPQTEGSLRNLLDDLIADYGSS